jgi:hypothetical protein
MNRLFFSLAGAVLSLGLLAILSEKAQAQWYPQTYYNYHYGPSSYAWRSYNLPGYSYGAPGYYVPPYYWSGQYYNTPFTRGWYYQRYSPWTNQYYYRYGVYPNWW